MNIGSGKSFPILSIAGMSIDLINPKIEPNYGALVDRPFEHEPIANVSETYARMRWKPKISLEVGLKKTVSWYRENVDRFSEVSMN